MYWEAKDTNAFGQVTEADLVDVAVTSRRVYDAATGP